MILELKDGNQNGKKFEYGHYDAKTNGHILYCVDENWIKNPYKKTALTNARDLWVRADFKTAYNIYRCKSSQYPNLLRKEYEERGWSISEVVRNSIRDFIESHHGHGDDSIIKIDGAYFKKDPDSLKLKKLTQPNGFDEYENWWRFIEDDDEVIVKMKFSDYISRAIQFPVKRAN